MLKVGLSSYSLSRAINNGEMDIFGAIRFTAEHGGKQLPGVVLVLGKALRG